MIALEFGNNFYSVPKVLFVWLHSEAVSELFFAERGRAVNAFKPMRSFVENDISCYDKTCQSARIPRG